MPARSEITTAQTGAEHSTLYVAIEISRKSWVVGLKSPAGERIGLHPLAAADVEGLKGSNCASPGQSQMCSRP